MVLAEHTMAVYAVHPKEHLTSLALPLAACSRKLLFIIYPRPPVLHRDMTKARVTFCKTVITSVGEVSD